MGGDMVTKTLNDAFGYDGWCLDVKNTTREEPIKDDKGRYHVAYIATVRITHRKSGVYREDCGSGDAIDRSLASASGNALKGAVTDAMKRAAKHFGEKMGNALYHDGFNANNAPPTLKDALNTLDIERAKSRFGFDKDRKVVVQQQQTVSSSTVVHQQHQTSNLQSSQSSVKQEQQKKAQVVVNSYASNTNTTKSTYAQQQQTPRTTYVGNVVMEHSNMSKAKQTSQPHVTPHHGNNNNNATAKQQHPTNKYVTPRNRVAPTTTKKKQSFDPSVFAAVPAEKLQENANPQQTSIKTTGLALPPRPGTSYGNVNNNTTATTPSMFGANGTMSQALTMEQQSQSTAANTSSGSLAQSLKRKSESIDGGGASSIAAKNPYSQMG